MNSDVVAGVSDEVVDVVGDTFGGFVHGNRECVRIDSVNGIPSHEAACEVDTVSLHERTNVLLGDVVEAAWR